MALSARRQWRFWGIGLGLTLLVMWLLGGVLLPFLAGAALAYILDPLADRLERLGMGRALATTLIAVAGLLVFALIMLFAVPALAAQAQALAEAMPDYVAQLTTVLSARFPGLFDENSITRRGLASAEAMLREGGMTLVNQLLASGLQVINFVVLLFVTPVVAFYLLLDWDKMVAKVNGALPREHAPTIRRLMREIDAVLAGFVRGQLAVCLILGVFYAVALMLIGLPYGFLVGMVAGLVSFIPFVGSTVGLLLSVGIALFTFWEQPFWIFVTAGIFGFGQFVEGNILSPHLVGKSVGLHPVLLILALSVFGALFGFAGLLIAVPVAASLGVLSRYAFEQYLASPLYSGKLPPEEP